MTQYMWDWGAYTLIMDFAVKLRTSSVQQENSNKKKNYVREVMLMNIYGGDL